MTLQFRTGATFISVVKIYEESFWSEVIGERKLRTASFVEVAFAEEVIGFMEFKDGSFEVGIGESLRPYNQLYVGGDRYKASEVYLRAIQERAWHESVKEEECSE